MADNFAWMIENYGHIPNGNRTYYLSRSQPPVFALMVELFEEDGVRGARRYLDHLKMEYAFWMDGAESLIPNQAYRHVVRIAGRIAAQPLLGLIATHRVTNPGLRTLKPRNILVARPTRCTAIYARGRPPVGINSSRWLRDTGRLASIRTTQFIPIDLNAFLF